MALRVETLAKIIADNPFPDGVDPPKNLHISFLSEPAKNVDRDRLNAAKTNQERYHITDHAAYIHLPDGARKSKLAAQMEKCLGVASTSRNWRSANKILDLAMKDM